MRLRAIRAIPHFCAGQVAACRAAILDALADEGGDGQKILRRRAALEALAAARTGDPADVGILTGFLGDDSRDLRVAAARALRDLCDPAALGALEARLQEEEQPGGVGQVRKALREAIQVVQQCGP
jgi:HEAT repeat protein